MLTNKSKEDRLRHWTLKRLLSDFCKQSLICELILALVSPWLLVNSFKETFREKRPIDFFIILFKDILIVLLLFCFFRFHQGYCVNDRLDLILTVIK